MNLGFNEPVQIDLDASEFASEAETFPIAKIVAAHAEKRRAEYQLTEKQIQRGLLDVEGYWSESVPWYEWMTEPQVLQHCAEECGLKIDQLAAVIAYQIRPKNWQVYSWMSVALQGRDFEEMLAGVLSRHAAELAKYRADRRRGADVTHRENRAMKAEVFKWLDSNMVNCKSMDAAAQAITKQQPIAFRTARDWVGAWKKLRSASTP